MRCNAMHGTVRGREVKKSGGGGRNWGNDAAAGMDNAAASADTDGNWGGANGTATNAEVCCCC